jgi:nucleoside-diphosphate-sugar epimerase
MGKRILMTGATGFLGSHLLAALVQEPGFGDVTILKRSFSDLRRIADVMPLISSFDLDLHPLEDVFHRGAYDVILHCATNYGRDPIYRASIIESNLSLPLRLLDLSSRNGTTTFINTDTLLYRHISDYSLSKYQFREWLRLATGRMTCIDMLLEHFFGPGDDRTKFVSGLIGALLEGRSRIELTDGLQTRDFIFIDDVTDAFLHVLRSSDRSSGYFEYEIGGGQPMMVKDVVELARATCANTTTQLGFGALAYRPNEPMNIVADTSRLQALGWRSRWTLRHAIETTVAAEKAANGKLAGDPVLSPACL